MLLSACAGAPLPRFTCELLHSCSTTARMPGGMSMDLMLGRRIGCPCSSVSLLQQQRSNNTSSTEAQLLGKQRHGRHLSKAPAVVPGASCAILQQLQACEGGRQLA